MSIGRFRVDPFVAALLAAAIVASFAPATGAVYVALQWVTRIAIALLFFLYGVRLSTSETLHGIKNWRLQAAVLATTFVMFPLAGIAAARLTSGWLGPVLASGILLLCLVPSTVQSNVVMTTVAGGDTAGAVVAASLSNVVGVFLTPALVAAVMAARAEVDGAAVIRIVAQLLAPFVLGQLARPLLAGWVRRNDHWLKFLDRSSVVLVVYVAFSAGATSGVWADTTVWAVVGVVGVAFTLLAAASAWAWGAGRVLGLARHARIALLFCGSNKSLATGLPMATVLFPGRHLALLVLPLMIYHQLQVLAGGSLAARLGRQHEH